MQNQKNENRNQNEKQSQEQVNMYNFEKLHEFFNTELSPKSMSIHIGYVNANFASAMVDLISNNVNTCFQDEAGAALLQLARLAEVLAEIEEVKPE